MVVPMASQKEHQGAEMLLLYDITTCSYKLFCRLLPVTAGNPVNKTREAPSFLHIASVLVTMYPVSVTSIYIPYQVPCA